MSDRPRARILRTASLLLALLALTACPLLPETGSAPAVPPPPPDPPGNATQKTLMSLPPNQRAAVLGNSVGKGCKGKTAYFMGTLDSGSAIWSLRCTNGRTYALEVLADAAGTTYAMPCAEYKTKTHFECFKKL